MSNLFLDEDGLRVYSEEVKEEISESIGNLSEFASEQITEDYEFKTSGGITTVFSFDAERYDRVTFTAYARGGDGVFGSMSFMLADDSDSSQPPISLASLSLSPTDPYKEQFVSIDCSGMSGLYTVRASGGGSSAITFGMHTITGHVKSAINVVESLNYLDDKIGDLTELSSCIVLDKFSHTYDTSDNIKICTIDVTNLTKIAFDAIIKPNGSNNFGATFYITEGSTASTNAAIGSFSESGSQPEQIKKYIVYDCGALSGDYTLSVGAPPGIAVDIQNITGYGEEYKDVVSGIKGLGAVPDISVSTLCEDWEFAAGYYDGYDHDLSANGTVVEFDATNIEKITLDLMCTSAGGGSIMMAIADWVGDYGISSTRTQVASTSWNVNTPVEIDCANLTGYHALIVYGGGSTGTFTVTVKNAKKYVRSEPTKTALDYLEHLNGSSVKHADETAKMIGNIGAVNFEIPYIIKGASSSNGSSNTNFMFDVTNYSKYEIDIDTRSATSASLTFTSLETNESETINLLTTKTFDLTGKTGKYGVKITVTSSNGYYINNHYGYRKPSTIVDVLNYLLSLHN